MKQVFENRVKRMLKEGKKTAGAWLHLCSPFSAEIMSRAGFDWLMIDMEHGPGDVLMLISQLQAMNGSDTLPFVRAPWNDFVAIKRILDAGVYGVMIPYVNNKGDAEAAVKACKYPPQGIRGIAGSPRAAGYGQGGKDYFPRANDEILIIAQIETAQAVSNLDEILAVQGIDVIFIGPMDLATSMGHLGNPGHPEVQVVIAAAEAKVLRAKKALGTISGSWEQARELYGRGYQLVMLMSDSVSLAKLASDTVAKFRETFPEG
jgi:2-keto-3-deoxy-L-rhamnonate aldolase RhmA